MDANKINNKIEIKETLDKVIKTDLKMEYLDIGLPIFNECPNYCYVNENEIEYKKSSKPCILCNKFCLMSITLEDITRPKLTRQTNQNLWVDCKKNDNKCDWFISNLDKETFYEKR